MEVKSAAAKHAKSWAANKRSTAAGHISAASRSRSTSVIPGGPTDPEAERKSEEKEDEEEPVDDKLYCVCKTKYDEERFMIACDRFVSFCALFVFPLVFVDIGVFFFLLVVMSGIIQHVSTCQTSRLNWLINSSVHYALNVSTRL